MSGAVLAAILGVGGLSAIISAVVAAVSSRRKLGAEATDIITKAAAGVVLNLQAEIDRQVAMRHEEATRSQKALETLMADHSREMSDVREVLQLHVAWDSIAIAKMAELGVQLPAAPPLLPPARQRTRHEVLD
jgi:hypothetical protein